MLRGAGWEVLGRGGRGLSAWRLQLVPGGMTALGGGGSWAESGVRGNQLGVLLMGNLWESGERETCGNGNERNGKEYKRDKKTREYLTDNEKRKQ